MQICCKTTDQHCADRQNFKILIRDWNEISFKKMSVGLKSNSKEEIKREIFLKLSTISIKPAFLIRSVDAEQVNFAWSIKIENSHGFWWRVGDLLLVSPHPDWRTAVGQLERGNRVLGKNLWFYLCLYVCVCVCVTDWLEPDTGPFPLQPSFALNSVTSAWLGDNTVFSALCGPCEGPTYSPWGPVSHPHSGVFWFPWLAPHLVLRGAGIIPQELIAHLITVGNTWPFLQGEEDEEEGQKKKREQRNRREQKRENKWGNMS